MVPSPLPTQPCAAWPEQVQRIEDRLSDLDAALRGQDPGQVESAAIALQKGLAEALAAYRSARLEGRDPLTPALRQKLALAQMRVSALQTSVHLAGASMQRTLGALFPSGTEAAPGATTQAPRTAAAAALNAYRG